MSEFVELERGEDGVAILRLDRPPANALSIAVLGEIAEAARGSPPNRRICAHTASAPGRVTRC